MSNALERAIFPHGRTLPSGTRLGPIMAPITHWNKSGRDRWLACGKASRFRTAFPSTTDKRRVTCPACLTHVRKVETP